MTAGSLQKLLIVAPTELPPCNPVCVCQWLCRGREGAQGGQSHTHHTDRHPLLGGSGGVRFVLLQDTRAQLLQKLQRTESKGVFIMELQNLHPLTQGTKRKDSELVWAVLSLLVLELEEKSFLHEVSSRHSTTNHCTKRKPLGHRAQFLPQLMLSQGSTSAVVLALPKLPGDSAEQQNSAETSRLEAEGAFLKVSGYCISISHSQML